MAESKGDMVTVTLEANDGQTAEVNLSAQLVDMLDSPNCDQAVKDAVFNQIFPKNNKAEFRNESPSPCTAQSLRTLQSTSPVMNEKCGTAQAKVHQWSPEEEKALIQLRTTTQPQFCGTKSHDSLWLSICNDLQKQGIDVTEHQVKNKWKNLKARYTQVIDHNSRTGNDRWDWKYLKEFDNLFGNKASTSVTTSFDSLKKPVLNNSNETDVNKSDTKPTRKRKRNQQSGNDEFMSVLHRIEKQNADALEEMKVHHNQQRDSMKSFLDLYAKSVNARTEK